MGDDVRESRSGIPPGGQDVTDGSSAGDRVRAIREHTRKMMSKLRALKSDESVAVDAPLHEPGETGGGEPGS